MGGKKHIFVRALFAASLVALSFGAGPTDTVEITRSENEYSQARVEAARVADQPGLAVVFQGTDDLHYYARSETAPAPGLQLRVMATSKAMEFGPAIFPAWTMFTDSLGEQIEVYVGDFTVLVPIDTKTIRLPVPETAEIEVTIAGIACTSQLCLPPFGKKLLVTVDLSSVESQGTISVVAVKTTELPPLALAEEPEPKTDTGRQTILPYGTSVYYLLAILAGLSINVMPCVLPVIPLILARLIDQSKRPGGSRLATGIAFCAGVILFFTVFALASAIINLTTGAVLDLNSLFRYPSAVIVLFLAIVFFGLAMLDVVTLSLPSSVTGRQSTAASLVGTAGMGFFAAILSTPCSGALLGFVLVWAQTQPLSISTIAIILMGVGMALPYAVIVSVPSLLERVPKPGTWMEVFKKSTGFLLFLIAAKLTLAALPKERLLNVLVYGIIFSFCVWMWGRWVGFSTPGGKKWAVRAIAVVLAVGAGLWLLPARPTVSTDWQPYDRVTIQQATAAGRPVLLKFTADWCSNCKLLDSRVFHDPEVAHLIEQKNVLPIRADTTLFDYPATIDLTKVYGEAGNVPVTIVLRPDDRPWKKRGIFGKDELIAVLKAIPE